MGADDLPEALCGDRCAEEIIGGFGCCFGLGLAASHDFADGFEPRPLMVFLEPLDGRGDRGGAGFNATMIAIDGGVDGDLPGGGIVEKSADIVMQRALVAFERQGIIATLIWRAMSR